MPRQPKTDMIYSRKSGAKAGANKKAVTIEISLVILSP